MNFNIFKLQDAYHYAIAAAVGRGDVNGQESSPASVEEFPRATWLKMAIKTAREAGYKGKVFAGCTTKERGMKLLDELNKFGRENGYDAYSSCKLCASCGEAKYELHKCAS